jgi:hypothetical protein
VDVYLGDVIASRSVRWISDDGSGADVSILIGTPQNSDELRGVIVPFQILGVGHGFVRPAEPLQAATMYRLTVAGIAGPDGEAIAPAVFSFTTKDRQADEARPDDESWSPNDRWMSGQKSHPGRVCRNWRGHLARRRSSAGSAPERRAPGRPHPAPRHANRADRSHRRLSDGCRQSAGKRRDARDRPAHRESGNRTYGFYEARITVGKMTTLVRPR